MIATILSVVVFASSNSTSACALSRLTSTLLTPGSLSKAAATEACQELQTIPLTSMVAILGAACAVTAATTTEMSTSKANRRRRSILAIETLHSTELHPGIDVVVAKVQSSDDQHDAAHALDPHS